MTDRELIDRLLRSDLTKLDNVTLLFEAARNIGSKEYAMRSRDLMLAIAGSDTTDNSTRNKSFMELERVYRWLAPKDFASYMTALEWRRRPEERFYLPRRKALQPIVMALQELADDKLDELFISQPPRTGKTTLLMFFVTWQLGRDSEKSNLYSAYSDTITNAFYNGVLEVITDPDTYQWHEIFPRALLADTNSKEEKLNVDRKKRYASLTCRSLYGTLNGACDCNGFLISDDLLSGIEEALSPDRLTTAWGKVDNNLLTRAKASCKNLWCGKRWSLAEPIQKRIDTLQDSKFRNHRYKVVNVPALNEKDESNFHYLYDVGFSSEYYRARRASFEANADMASWFAQYQGEPIERQGTVFAPDQFRYFNGVLPSDIDGIAPDRVFMAVDPAWGGGDFTASPVIAKFGEDLYVIDVVFDDGDKTVTQRLIADTVEKQHVAAVQIEATKMTREYAEGVDKILKTRGVKVNLTTRTATGYTVKGKEQRIFDKAPEIRTRMIFLDPEHRSKSYNLFMQQVFSFKISGKNKHDDAPDSLCMAICMDEETAFRPKVRSRVW